MVRQRFFREAQAKSKPKILSSSRTLLNWDELEEWQKDNEYIHTGYVKSQNSYRAVLDSLFYVHNETGNIYTHLLPSATVLVLIMVLVVTSLQSPPFLLFALGCVACMGMSATFHCLKSHSHRVAIIGNKFDYLGICILIASSMVALLTFAYDDKPLHYIVFVGITAALCVACSIVSLMDKFRSREYRSTRATMFVCYGLSGVLPVVFGALEFGYNEMATRAACNWLYAEAFFYILGATIYALRIPEKWNPGHYDIIGHSHQIFHVLVVVAALCHYTALKGAQHSAHLRSLAVQNSSV